MLLHKFSYAYVSWFRSYLTKIQSLVRVSGNLSLPFQVTSGVGRAIAQAVSRRLPTAAARVQTRVWSCGIL
jgi:hypothetical protein